MVASAGCFAVVAGPAAVVLVGHGAPAPAGGGCRGVIPRRKTNADGGMEALRILKRRLSDVIYAARSSAANSFDSSQAAKWPSRAPQVVERGVGLFGPAARRLPDLAREGAEADRNPGATGAAERPETAGFPCQETGSELLVCVVAPPGLSQRPLPCQPGRTL